MKRIIQTLILSVCSILAFGQTNEYMVLEQADGTVQKLNINDVVRITFENEGNGNSVIDETFIPSLTDILGVWNGEYEGWDVRQQTECKIKRELALYPDGTYTNNLQGAMGMRTEYVDFEREAGMYSYDSQTQMVTYTALTDSLINFRTHQLTSSTKDTYQEKAQFSYIIDGQRRWVMQDNGLVSKEDKVTPVQYLMEKTEDVTAYYYVGNMNGWDITNRDYPFTKQSDGNIWTLTMETNHGDTFLIIPSLTTNWDDGLIYRGQRGMALEGTYTRDDIMQGENFTVPSVPGMLSYTITINPETMHYEIIINTNFDIDNSFIPTKDYLCAVWKGEYSGWDKMQQVQTDIRRILALYPNGTYTNTIAGKLPSIGIDSFIKFEAEGGTWTYQDGTVTYMCQYDSLLNFSNQSFTVYTKKHCYDHETDSYTEQARFTYMHDGIRGWVTQDNNLQVSATDNRSVAYVMNKAAELPNIEKGTLDNPYSASEANAYAASLEANQKTEDYVYVKGFISEIQEVSTTYGNATYYIADSQTSENAFFIYRGRYLNNEAFTNESQIKVGDEVILYARLTNYRGTLPETVTGECYIYSLNGKTEPETSDDLFNEPYITWGASVDEVKSAMQDYMLVNENNNDGFVYLIYSGKLQELYTAYGIDAKRNLVTAQVAVDVAKTTVANLDESIQKKYVYVYESDGIKMYMSADAETVVFLSEIDGYFLIDYYSTEYLLADDDDEIYYEEPYANWNATPSVVKGEMTNRGYTLYDEGTNSSGLYYLAYLGEQKETLSLYWFNAQQILAQIDIAFSDVTVVELEEFVTTQWGYTFAGNGTEGEDVYATPDNNSYVFIYSLTLSDGSVVTYASYIKRATASARSLVRGQNAGQDILGLTAHDDATDNLRVLELYKHFKAGRPKATFMQK